MNDPSSPEPPSTDPSPAPGPPPVPPPQAAPSAPSSPPPAPAHFDRDGGIQHLIPIGRSVWAIIAGYLGLFAVLLLPAPLALVTGIIAWRDIQKSKSSPKPKLGMGRALFAIIMGALGTALLIAILVSGAFSH